MARLAALAIAAFAAAAPSAASIVDSETCAAKSCGQREGLGARESVLLQVGHGSGVAKIESSLPTLPAPYLEPLAHALPSQGSSSSLLGLAQSVESRAESPSWAELEHFRLLKEMRTRGHRCPSRAFPGIPETESTFQFDCRLWRAARYWSSTMGRNNFFSHVWQGSNPCTRTAQEGLPACGENIAAGEEAPAKALEQFKDSDAHCVNMMNPDYNRFAVGYVATQGSQWTHYWTQSMGTDDEGPPDQSCLSSIAPTQAPPQTPTQRPTAPSTPTTCEDTELYHCGSYRSQGYCSTSDSVKRTCRKTCGFCSVSPQTPTQRPTAPREPTTCEDTEIHHCGFYRSQGYCSTSDSVKRTCRKTCGLCSASPQTPTAPRPPTTCEDTERHHCGLYRSQGYCSTVDSVKKTCRKTCGLCR